MTTRQEPHWWGHQKLFHLIMLKFITPHECIATPGIFSLLISLITLAAFHWELYMNWRCGFRDVCLFFSPSLWSKLKYINNDWMTHGIFPGGWMLLNLVISIHSQIEIRIFVFFSKITVRWITLKFSGPTDIICYSQQSYNPGSSCA